MFNQFIFHTKQSSKTRFVNYVYQGDEVIGHINGALKHQVTADSLKNLLARAIEVKDTSELRYQPYVTETKIEEEIKMNKEITMIAKGNKVKEMMKTEAIKICNNEDAVDIVMESPQMVSMIQQVVRENVIKTSHEVPGMKKVFIKFKEDGYNYDVIILGSSDMVLYENEKEQKDVEELFEVSEKEVYNIDECVYLGYEEIIVA